MYEPSKNAVVDLQRRAASSKLTNRKLKIVNCSSALLYQGLHALKLEWI